MNVRKQRTDRDSFWQAKINRNVMAVLSTWPIPSQKPHPVEGLTSISLQSMEWFKRCEWIIEYRIPAQPHAVREYGRHGNIHAKYCNKKLLLGVSTTSTNWHIQQKIFNKLRFDLILTGCSKECETSSKSYELTFLTANSVWYFFFYLRTDKDLLHVLVLEIPI